MFIKKTVLTVLIILFTCVSALWAGDSAVFVDLGFSQDGRTYMFGQYGVQTLSLRPWAEVFVVDVARNAFVQNGRASVTQNEPIRAGQDGSGAFHKLVSDNSSLTSRYGISFQNQGLPLYISRNENPPAYSETITFRDFLSSQNYLYTAQLIPTITGSGQNVKSQFYIQLEVLSSTGQGKKSYTIGTPNFVRQGIMQYNIKRVIIDASGSSVIFVIEMKRAAADGFDIRYMVEAVRL